MKHELDEQRLSFATKQEANKDAYNDTRERYYALVNENDVLAEEAAEANARATAATAQLEDSNSKLELRSEALRLANEEKDQFRALLETTEQELHKISKQNEEFNLLRDQSAEATAKLGHGLSESEPRRD